MEPWHKQNKDIKTFKKLHLKNFSCWGALVGTNKYDLRFLGTKYQKICVKPAKDIS